MEGNAEEKQYRLSGRNNAVPKPLAVNAQYTHEIVKTFTANRKHCPVVKLFRWRSHYDTASCRLI